MCDHRRTNRVAVQATLEDSFDFAAGPVRRLLATCPAEAALSNVYGGRKVRRGPEALDRLGATDSFRDDVRLRRADRRERVARSG
jgi:hypothetical protein